MAWFCFPGGWGCYDLNGLAAGQMYGLGAHGYATEQVAQQHVNASPNILQQAYLQTLKAASVAPVGAGVTGDLKTPSSTGGVSGTLANLFGGGGSAHWLTRIVEILLGLALVAVGVARITRAVPAATQVAKIVGGVA